MSGPVPEPEVTVPSSRRLWIALLAGPSLWFGHFMAVYVLAEIVCVAGSDGQPSLGVEALRWAILAITAVVLVVLAIATRQTWTYHGRGVATRPLMLIGVGLDLLFALAIAATAIPALVLMPC